MVRRLSKINKKTIRSIKAKVKESTGKTLTKAKPKEIKLAFRSTVLPKFNTRIALAERRRMIRGRKK
jgi:hypothetical protein